MTFVFAAENTLPNGAVIESYHQHCEFRVVLARWRRGDKLEWVTWRCDADGNCYWGHYHQGDQLAALEEFEQRCNKGP